jgi:hypothetical protein
MKASPLTASAVLQRSQEGFIKSAMLDDSGLRVTIALQAGRPFFTIQFCFAEENPAESANSTRLR